MFRSNSRRLKSHVDSFKNHPNLQPSTRIAAKGIYDTVFECKSGQVFVLRVDCRSDPIMVKLFGCRAEHPLVDTDMFVRISYRDDKLLGAAMMEIIVQMQLNPPKILEITDPHVRALQKKRPEEDPVSPQVEDAPGFQGTLPFAIAEPIEIMLRNSMLQPQINHDLSLTSGTSSSQRPPMDEIRSCGQDSQSYAPGYKDQAQTVLESGANTPSVDSELPLVEAQMVDDDPRQSHHSRRSSDPSGTHYSFATPES